MELAIAVLCWTLAVCSVLVTLMSSAWIQALTNLANARAQSEKRLHP